jgi:addiction module HigA family antidote
MASQKIRIIHPGSILKTEFMEPLGISNYRLAKASGLSEAHIGRIVRGMNAISAEVALRLEAVFGMGAETWLNLQNIHDLLTARQQNGKAISKTTQRLIEPPAMVDA